MREISLIRHSAAALVGFGSGIVISGAVFAFIAVIGVVTRLAQKAGAAGHIRTLENAVLAGGIFGAAADVVELRVPLFTPVVAFLALCAGVFYGSLAASLAEVLDVMPVLTRRVRLSKGMFWLIAALAAGKLAGSLLSEIVGGFSK